MKHNETNLHHPPICDECECEMDYYTVSYETKKSGWVCPNCGWNYLWKDL